MTFVQLVIIVLKVHIVPFLVNLVSTVLMQQWPHLKEIALRDFTVTTVLLCPTSLTVQWVTTVHPGLASRLHVLQGSSPTLLGTRDLEIVGIAPLVATVLEQEIMHPQTNALHSITALVVKAQQHQESIFAHQVTSALWAHHNLSDAKMEPSKTSLAKAFARLAQKGITVMPQTQPW